jgi:hypothetical protein
MPPKVKTESEKRLQRIRALVVFCLVATTVICGYGSFRSLRSLSTQTHSLIHFLLIPHSLLPLPYLSPTSPLPLPYLSPTSPLLLPYIHTHTHTHTQHTHTQHTHTHTHRYGSFLLAYTFEDRLEAAQYDSIAKQLQISIEENVRNKVIE